MKIDGIIILRNFDHFKVFSECLVHQNFFWENYLPLVGYRVTSYRNIVIWRLYRITSYQLVVLLSCHRYRANCRFPVWICSLLLRLLQPSSRRQSSGKINEVSLQPATSESVKAHQFIVRTFNAPIKCNHCTSLMVGINRQGTTTPNLSLYIAYVSVISRWIM